MPTGLKQYQANREAYAVPFRCHRRGLRLAEPGAYETFARVFEQARRRHSLPVYAYLVMSPALSLPKGGIFAGARARVNL